MDGLKKIGITGAGGFIGKEFSKYLYDKKYEIVLFSEEEIIKDKKIRYIKKDLNQCTPEDFFGIDTLFHLAGTSFNEEALKKNFLLTQATLKNAIEANVKRFFLASSYAVYGDRKTPANIEDSLNPLDEYSLSKILSEYILKKEILNKNIEGSIIRICSVYGNEGKGIINILKKRIKENKEIKIDGNFERQYLYVKDLCKIFEDLLNEEDLQLFYNVQGENMSSKNIMDILEKKGVNSYFNDINKTSYLCKGLQIKSSLSIEDFIFEN